MIKIISGVYGAKQPKTPKDEPFSLSPGEEARLVRRGVAMYVSGTACAPSESFQSIEQGDNCIDAKNASESNVEAIEKPVYSVDMKSDELKELLKAVGLPVKAVMAKTDMVSMLDAYYGEEDEDGEEPPKFGAAEPVS